MLLGATLVAVLILCGASAQTPNNQLNGQWIPTDLNYKAVSDLRQNSLQTPAEQIAGVLKARP